MLTHWLGVAFPSFLPFGHRAEWSLLWEFCVFGFRILLHCNLALQLNLPAFSASPRCYLVVPRPVTACLSFGVITPPSPSCSMLALERAVLGTSECSEAPLLRLSHQQALPAMVTTAPEQKISTQCVGSICYYVLVCSVVCSVVYIFFSSKERLFIFLYFCLEAP